MPLDVRWSMTSEPQIGVTLDESGDIRVDGSAEMSVSYVQPSEYEPSTSETESITADLGGSATYDGETPSVTYEDGNVDDTE